MISCNLNFNFYNNNGALVNISKIIYDHKKSMIVTEFIKSSTLFNNKLHNINIVYYN